MQAIARSYRQPGELRVNGMNRMGPAAQPCAVGVSQIRFKQRSAAAPASALPSYWLLLAFLILLYANTPFVLPAAEVVHPAKVIAAAALLSFALELAFGRRKLEWSWPEGGLLLVFLAAGVASCLTALWPGYAADAAETLSKMTIIYFFIVNC